MGHSPDDDNGTEHLAARHQRLRLEQRLFGRADTAKVGRYTLGAPIGAGGMGTVYEATDPGLERKLAIKLLLARYALVPNAAARLVREAKALARLSHPHVVTVHEVGIVDDQPFVAMELMPGGTLADWVGLHPPGERGRVDALVRMLRQCAQGLLAAHDAQLVHRDFKPHNVLLAADGTAKVADFGLVRLSLDQDDGETTDDGLDASDERRPLTGAGVTPGTAGYMAPEQRRGIADARSDQYALCKTFVEAFGDEPTPRGVAEILRVGTLDDPDRRHPDLRALLARLDVATRPRRRPALAIGIGIAALGVTAIVLNHFAAAPAAEPVIACDDGRSSMDDAWGEVRQAEIRAAFERSGAASQRVAWDNVRTRFDGYVEAWSAARLDACEATMIRRVQDERMMAMRTACLDQRHRALVVLSDAYAQADAAVVEDAPITAHALPNIESCADREELEHGRDAIGLDDPRLRAQYDAVGEADALRNLRRDDEAAAGYDATVPGLEELGADALLAKVHRWRAWLVNEGGDYERGEALGRLALRHAELSGRDVEIAYSWLRMGSTARLRGRYDDADLYIERAENIAARRPMAGRLKFAVADSRAHYEGARGNTEKTLAALERADSVAEEVDAKPAERLELRKLKLQLLVLLGREDEALTYGEQLLADAQEMFGPDHMVTLGIAATHAGTFLQRGQYDKAAELTEPAVRRPMSKVRPDQLASIRGGYAQAQRLLGNHDAAQRVHEQTIAEGTLLLGGDHPEVFLHRMALGTLHLAAKRYAEAVDQLLPLAEIAGREVEGDANGAMHPLNRHAFWGNLAAAQCNLGQKAAAIESMDLSERIGRAASAPGSIWIFRAATVAGELYEECGAPERARTRYAEALELSKSLEVDPADLAILKAGLARLH